MASHRPYAPATPRIEISPQLVERYVLDLASFGAVGATGVSRPVYSPAWVAATERYATWCRETGLEVRRDAVGNVWGVLAGTAGGGSVVSGSHMDSQTPGGRYDGSLGALAGLIAVGALRERYGPPRRTLEAVALCEEEGSRFPSAGWWARGRSRAASRPATGTGSQATRTRPSATPCGRSASSRNAAAWPDATTSPLSSSCTSSRGPILEQAGLAVAIVDAITGIRHYGVELAGTQNHAGAFPMDMRRDPMAGFAEVASGLINTAHRLGRPAVTTVGRVGVDPNFPAIVPAKVSFTIDARHPDPAARERLYAMHEGLLREVAARRNLDLSLWTILDHPPCLCDPDLVATLKTAAADQGVPTMVMASGAGHDYQQMAAIAPVAMIFVRSKDGRSHTPDEFSSIEDIVAGIEVLAAALHRLAY